MTDQHPITPPPELVRQWIPAGWDCSPNTFTTLLMRIADNAALWSHDHCKSKIKAATDQELEACCEWLSFYSAASDARDLRIARRPKPPSLKEQAFQALCRFQAAEGHESCTEEEIVDDFNTIRRALEALDD
jgi:hypothetical protein